MIQDVSYNKMYLKFKSQLNLFALQNAINVNVK